MAPTEFASAQPMSSAARSVAAFFGDDSDSQPLWFKKEVFSASTFDSEAYIAGLRRFVPFDTLRAELRSHLAVLKNELVELINRDYADFVNLSTKLVDVDGAVLRMRMPFNELRGKLVAVRETVNGSLAALQDGLKRRAEASSSREILELLLDTSHVVSKVEKLLVELQNMAEEGTHASHSEVGSNGSVAGEFGFSSEGDRSRLLERIASEMNRLKFYVARAQDLPFIHNMEKRIHAADVSLDGSLRGCFVAGLERQDRNIVYHCLCAYAAIDNTAGAEEAYRAAVVAPAVEKMISPDPSKSVAEGDVLEEVYDNLRAVVAKECKFLLDLSAAPNSGLHMFDFLSNSILREVHTAIQKERPGAFSPGKPVEFLKNYRSSLKFIDFLEGQYSSQAAVMDFRSKAAYRDFMKQWNLNVYFTLRFQEIAGALDTALMAASLHGGREPCKYGDVALMLHPSIALWESLQRCWQDDVYIPSIADKFLRMALQLISKYSSWLSSGVAARNGVAGDGSGPEWASGAAPDDVVLVRNDVESLVKLIKGPYVESIEEVLAGRAEEVVTVVRVSIFQGAQALLDILPALTDVLTDALAERCVEVLKQLKGITTTYRMTNKPLPTRHSPYVSGVLQPLKTFMEGERAGLLNGGTRLEVLSCVVEKTTARYDELGREVVTMARRTESSLLRLRQGARQRGVGADTSDSNVSDTEKICAQLFLDVQEYARRLKSLGVSVEKLPTFRSLWECVAPPDRKSDIRF